MSRPRIGITTSYKDGAQMLDHHYVRAIERAGGLPMIAPMFTEAEAAHAFSALLDGLLITGGPGITQGLIGQLPADLPPVDPLRYQSDTLLYQTVTDRPVFGICYGMQFINAQAGGTIYADVVAQRQGAIVHAKARGADTHPLHIEPQSWLGHLFKSAAMEVNTYHIQAIAEIGSGLKPAAYGPDGIIEAIESADGRLIGVQFHPERMLEHTLPLFEDFIQRCRRETA